MHNIPRDVILAVVVALCGIAAALYFMSRPSPVSDPVGYHVQALQKIVPDLQMASLPPTEQELSALLARGSFTPINEMAIAQRQAAPPPFSYIQASGEIRNHVATMLHTRLLSHDPSAYIAWREANGYRFVTPSEFNETFHDQYTWEMFIVDDPVMQKHAVRDIRHAFELLWDAPLEQHGFSRINAIARDEMGVHLAFGQTWNDEPHTLFQEKIVTEIPFETWYGGVSSACAKWFRPPRWAAQVLEQEGTVYTASLGMVVGFSKAPPRPMIVKLFFDPREQKWFVERIFHQNYHGEPGLSPCIEM